MSETKQYTAKILQSLYLDGIVNLGNVFDKKTLDNIVESKNKAFLNFPKPKELIREDHRVQNLEKIDKNFIKILENHTINLIAEEILGEGYIFTSLNMRTISKTTNTMITHRDFCGGLAFSLLLDDIDYNQGETIFFKGSYNYPPPKFCKKRYFKNKSSTVGKTGDVYLWFPETWHGRNFNETKKETCILMGTIENSNSVHLNILKSTDNKKNKIFINKIFAKLGNTPDGLIRNFFYNLLRYKFKFIAELVDNKKITYTRFSKKELGYKDFSIKEYFNKIDIFKTIKIFVFDLIKILIGKSNIQKIKKFLNKA